MVVAAEEADQYSSVRNRNPTKTMASDNKAPPSDSPSKKGYFGLGDDFFSVCVLMFLYVLQGVPLGLSSSIPILIQKNIKGYSQQAAFSIVLYPFSCKLLWAPIVDCFYCPQLGRRKSWLVPLQYCIGAVMLYIPNVIGEALGHNGGDVKISVLAGWFCFLTFLAATQDIAVDGWALTMLSKRNVGWASTCNAVGQNIGYFFGYLGFLALESPVFCNYFRSVEKDVGCVTMESYMVFWGCTFIVTTTLVMLLVREKEVEEEEEDEGVVQTYFNMMRILKLKNVAVYLGCIFAIKASFSPVDSLSALKLMDAGLPKETMISLSAFLIPLQIVLPLLVTKYSNTQFPLNTFVVGIWPRILGVLLCTLFVFYTYNQETLTTGYYIIGLSIQILYSLAGTMMFVSFMMYNARISDAKMGGTYMTLLNTFSNLSGTIPQTLSLYLVDRVTMSSCNGVSGDPPSCYMDKETCSAAGGQCQTDLDGFYILVTMGTLLALFWQWKLSKVFLRLQSRPLESWHVSRSSNCD